MASTQLGQVPDRARAVGLPVPDAVEQAEQYAARIGKAVSAIEREAAREHRYGIVQEALEAVADNGIEALDTRPDLARAVTLETVVGTAGHHGPSAIREVHVLAVNAVAAAVVNSAEDMIAGWRKPFEKTATAFVAAVNELPMLADLSDTDAVARAGGSTAEAWVRAQQGSSALDGFARLLTMLEGLYDAERDGTAQGAFKALRLVDVPAEDAVRLQPSEWSCFALARRGYGFRLCSPSGWRSVTRAVAAAWQERYGKQTLPTGARL